MGLTPMCRPSLEQFKALIDRLLPEAATDADMMMAMRAALEVIEWREAVQHVIDTCSDASTVSYLRARMRREPTKR
jgi:hypothetical protein